MSGTNTTQVLQSARVQTYRFLSRLFEKEMTKQLLDAVSSLDFDAPYENALMREGYAGLKAFFAQELANREDELAAEYARVFLAAGIAKGKAAFPYESVYTSKEKIVMQRAWEDVSRLMEQKGLALSGVEADVKEDHIAAELLFAAWLVENDLPDEAATFRNTHLLNWVDQFAADVEELSSYGFYPAATKLLRGFLELEEALLSGGVEELPETVRDDSFVLTAEQADGLLAGWKKRYRVLAPKLLNRRGADPVLRYQEIDSFSEICNDRSSDFSAKEAYYPVSQTMLYFTDTEVKESQITDDRGILLFLHPCDINAMRRLDNMFLKNGGHADLYYKRLRDKVKAVLLECKESGEHCFCVSMQSNVAEDYEMAVRLGGEQVFFHVKAAEWIKDFREFEKAEFTPRFITENKVKVATPVIQDTEALLKASKLPYWEKFNDSCISCGGCNTVCPTCACFDTVDVIYHETSKDGERRRVWSSCMLDTFTMTAGGARARKTPGENMRFKTLHKVYDYQKRFQEGENMCVGCGRCTVRCPKQIDFSDTLNGFTRAMQETERGGAE